MKKEWLAVTLLISVSLGSFLNLRFLRSFTQDLQAQMEEAVEQADLGNWSVADALASQAMEDWTCMDKYTHIFIRHDSIDAVTDGFCSLLGTIRIRDAAALVPIQLMLRGRLTELYEMERVTPGSIL